MHYFLVKSESSCYSIDDLKRDKTTLWTEVRNYQARNTLKSMKKGDLILYYHSVDDPIGVAGIAKVVKEFEPDPTQFDKNGEYFEPRATKEKPVWFCPTISFIDKFPQVLLRERLKDEKKLTSMVLMQKGSRLSVQPVKENEFELILKLARG